MYFSSIDRSYMCYCYIQSNNKFAYSVANYDEKVSINSFDNAITIVDSGNDSQGTRTITLKFLAAGTLYKTTTSDSSTIGHYNANSAYSFNTSYFVPSTDRCSFRFVVD